MPVTTRQIRRRNSYLPKLLQQPQWATLWLLGAATCFAAISLAWFADVGAVTYLFECLNHWQRDAAAWFHAPSDSVGWKLSLVLLLGVQVITRLCPQPRAWSRFIVITILLVLITRYLLWRSLTTLNLSTPLEGVISLGLFVMEMLIIVSYGVQLFFMLRERDRRHEADRYSVAVEAGHFVPSVSILIPTFNEPAVVLRRTIIGCQALDYPHKQVYLLDDGNRDGIRQLAADLGCHYMVRPDNRHAKAGNLNYAIAHTESELIVVFDADFVPTRNFLTRTVGFFQNPQIGMVQTHQYFYNADPPARNLGLEKELTHEVEIFSRHYQLVRDGANSALCYGSSFVVRRSALEAVGGFVTNTLSEDYFTGIRIAAQGQQVIYLDENLSAGLVPENMPAHIAQRQRWARGTLQAFFIQSSPMTISGLTLRQRIAHLEGILQWFNSLCRAGFLLVPIATVLLGIMPVVATIPDWAFFFLPLYLTQFSTFAWLNHRSRAALVSDIYSVIQCFPLSVTVIQTLICPFSKGFQVTPKGTVTTKTVFHWQLASPLILLWILTLACFVWEAYILTMHPEYFHPEMTQYWKFGLIWCFYNLLVLGISILCFIDIPKPDAYEWFEQQRAVQVQMGRQVISGLTRRISEAGAEVMLTRPDGLLVQTDWAPNGGAMLAKTRKSPVKLHLPVEQLTLQATVAHLDLNAEQPIMTLMFEPLNLMQQRQLIELLFCNPGQWQRQPAPGELRMLWLLCRSLLRPRTLSKPV
jgi:cellulose synthase (UDP-forming)